MNGNNTRDELNVRLWCEIIQCLDIKSLMLVRSLYKNQGREAYEKLQEHFKRTDKPRVMSLMAKLAGLKFDFPNESIQDYLIRTERRHVG